MEREVANGDRGEEHRNHVGKVVAMGTPSMRFSESAEDPFALGRGASAVLDDQGTVVGWSARAQELLGYPAKEVIGRAWQDLLVDALDLPAARSVVVDAIRTGAGSGSCPCATATDGVWKWVSGPARSPGTGTAGSGSWSEPRPRRWMPGSGTVRCWTVCTAGHRSGWSPTARTGG